MPQIWWARGNIPCLVLFAAVALGAGGDSTQALAFGDKQGIQRPLVDQAGPPVERNSDGDLTASIDIGPMLATCPRETTPRSPTAVLEDRPTAPLEQAAFVCSMGCSAHEPMIEQALSWAWKTRWTDRTPFDKVCHLQEGVTKYTHAWGKQMKKACALVLSGG